MNQPLDHTESTFNQWWESLSANEQKVLQRHNALFVWKQAITTTAINEARHGNLSSFKTVQDLMSDLTKDDVQLVNSIKIGNYYLGPIKPNNKIKLFNEYGEGGDFPLKKLEILIDTFFCNEF